jgi:hypothetical protein
MNGLNLPHHTTLYYEHFPYSWYKNEKKKTGPDACSSCKDTGCVSSDNGERLFVMYCQSCRASYNMTLDCSTVPLQEMSEDDLLRMYRQMDVAYVPLILPLSIQIKPLSFTIGISLPNRTTLYDERFPVSWYLKEKKGTGPDECDLCLQKGCEMTNDGPVFQLYCWNCMHHHYSFTRGYNITQNEITDFTSYYKRLDKKYIPIKEPMLLITLRNE